eukprot:TRINITY_DN51781_c0_g1_i1.p1 TRINITY_DN51781_c0_g1~~TRINITY_DN51781_c0_g1_i1.p1  ORF type:complete len:278 (-),score=101.02 TRINITY_DN51781_c0_g1_i1:1413-2246(-)
MFELVRAPQSQREPRLHAPRAPTKIRRSPGLSSKGDDLPEPETDMEADAGETMSTQATSESFSITGDESEYPDTSDDGCGILRWFFKEEPPAADDEVEGAEEESTAADSSSAGRRSPTPLQREKRQSSLLCCDCCWAVELVKDAKTAGAELTAKPGSKLPDDDWSSGDEGAAASQAGQSEEKDAGLYAAMRSCCDCCWAVELVKDAKTAGAELTAKPGSKLPDDDWSSGDEGAAASQAGQSEEKDAGLYAAMRSCCDDVAEEDVEFSAVRSHREPVE